MFLFSWKLKQVFQSYLLYVFNCRIAPALPDAFNLADPDTAGANLGTDCSSDYLQIGPNRHCGAALSNTMAQLIGTTIYGKYNYMQTDWPWLCKDATPEKNNYRV